MQPVYTLLLIKPEDVNEIHKLLNNFDLNLQFTVNKFVNETPHFLDIEMSPDGLQIYRKETNTGQYVSFDSYVPWNHKISWIWSLTSRAKKICDDNTLSTELSTVRKFVSWNDFPKKICHGVIKRTLQNVSKNDVSKEVTNNDKTAQIWIKLCYHGEHSEQLIKNLQRKLQRFTKPDQSGISS